VTNGVARHFGHCGGDANLVLRIEVEQGADLSRALAAIMSRSFASSSSSS
jgi:hypothetical protein